MSERLECSVILPVCHGGALLKNALASLRKIVFSSDRFEVLVAGSSDDSESKDTVATEASKSSFAMVYVVCDGENRAAKLNAACYRARGRFLVFADDDCIFHEDWLKNLCDVLNREANVGIVGGVDEPAAHNASAFDQALDKVLHSFLGTGGFRYGRTSPLGKYYPRLWNMAVPKEVVLEAALKKANGALPVFDEDLTVHEDVDLAKRIEKQGRRIIFAPEVRVGHKRDTTFREFVCRNFSMARTARFLQVHRLAHTALTAFVLGMPVIAFGSFFVCFFRPVFFGFVVIYAIILLGKGIEGLLKTKNVRVGIFIPLLLMSLHLGRGFGYLFPSKRKTAEASHKT